MIVVSAQNPKLDAHNIGQILVMAEMNQTDAVIVINKQRCFKEVRILTGYENI